MSSSPRVVSQWPAFGLAGALHAAGLLTSLSATVDLGRTRLALWLPVALGLILLAAIETATLILLNALLEHCLPTARRRPFLDAVKGGGLALLVLIPALSGLKLRATGVHLRRSDLWFAYSSWRQVMAEGTTREVLLFVAPPLAWSVLTVLFAWLLARWRRPSLPSRRALTAVWIGGLAGVALLWLLQPALGRLVRELVPEAHWTTGRTPAFGLEPQTGGTTAERSAGGPRSSRGTLRSRSRLGTSCW
ncbi:MAG: hypothetical protein R2991_13115 [Thermoanaerobaculia bacterium]